MSRYFFCALLCVACLLAKSADVPIKIGSFEVVFETRGGGIKSLLYDKEQYVEGEGNITFAERIMANAQKNGKDAQIQERFDALQFKVDTTQISWDKANVVMTCRGAGAFDWLRMEKTFSFKQKSPMFEVTYRLTNLDTEPHDVSLWIRNFFRAMSSMNQPNIYYQPRKEGVTELLHPGPTVTGDEWCLQPAEGWCAVGDTSSKRGVLITLDEMPTAFYNWFSLTKLCSTSEIVTDQYAIAPGKTIAYNVHVLITKNLPDAMAKLDHKRLSSLKRPQKELFLASYFASGRERELPFFQNATGNVKRSSKSITLDVPVQLTSSVRELIIPDNVEPENCAVFEVANGKADYSAELPTAVEKRPDGKAVLRFQVPGANISWHSINHEDKKIIRSKYGYSSYIRQYRMKLEVAFDRKPTLKIPADILADGPNLVYNGTFTRPNKSTNPKLQGMPDGFPTSCDGRRNRWYNWHDGVFSISKPTNNPEDKYVQFAVYFQVEKSLKYNFSMKVKNDNSVKGIAPIGINFFDADGKSIESNLKFYKDAQGNHDWKTIELQAYAPDNAKWGCIIAHVYGLQKQILSIDDIKIVPEPYSGTPVKLIDRLRDQLVSSWYKPLPLIEDNSDAIETQHLPWMKPAAFKMPEILYLPMNKGSYTDLDRRFIVELTQRMPFMYRYIPLLQHVSYINGSGIMGVYANTYDNKLETYTYERLKEVTDYPAVILVQAVNFKTDVDAPLAEFLAEKVKGGSKLLFVDCQEPPVNLLGAKSSIPPELLVVPKMQNVKDISPFLTYYEKGAVMKQAKGYSYRFIPMVPQNQIRNTYPSLSGRDFPFLEYIRLTCAKIVRDLSGTKIPVKITAAETDGKELTVTILSAKDGTAQFRCAFNWGNQQHKLADGIRELKLSKGQQQKVRIPLAQFPEGESVAEYRIVMPDGTVSDAAATRISNPTPTELAISGDKRKFEYGQDVTFSVSAKAGSIRVQIEDCDRRVVFDKTYDSPKADVLFKPAAPLSAFYYIIATCGNARVLGEFTIVNIPRETTELLAMMWPSGNPEKYPFYRKYGYNQLVTWCRENTDACRAQRLNGLEPIIYGAGSASYVREDAKGRKESWTDYKSDKASAPVRNPCFSDPKTHENAEKSIKEMVLKNKLDYYGIRAHLIGDEQYIGSTVCYDEHCIELLRRELKAEFKDVEALNKEWGTGFNTWEDVVPCQSKELKDRRYLGQWLDHKMFMNRVFAGSYMAGVKKSLNAYAPGSIMGLSGTDNPGYSYDWGQVMKQLDYIAYYDGIQRKLAQDLGKPGIFNGQWYGGYVAPVPSDGYCGTFFWRGLIMGANLSAIYAPRAGITGTLDQTPVLKHFEKLYRESQEGLARIVLTAQDSPEIAMLYSQRSLFACAGTIGMNEWKNSNTGWHAILTDLGFSYKYIYTEGLEKDGLDVGRVRLLILPCAIALSDKELERINAFIDAGGTVVSDVIPGIYDGHGKLRETSLLAKRFVAGPASIPQIKSVKVASQASDDGFIPAVASEFRTAAANSPYLRSCKIGKGHCVSINLLASGYQSMVLGGTGGEVSNVESGADSFCNAYRAIVLTSFKAAGVHPFRTLVGKDGKPRQATTCLRTRGSNAVFGILNENYSIATLDKTKGEDITVKLPVKGHVYDIRTHKYLGETDTFDVFLSPADGQFFSILPKQIAGISLDAPKAVKAGEQLTFRFKAQSASNQNADCPLTFYYRFTSPSGKIYDRYFGTVPTDNANGSATFQTAFNDEPGTWSLLVRCSETGHEKIAKIILK